MLHCAGLPGLEPHLVPGEGLQLVQGEGEGELEGAGAPGNSIRWLIAIVSSFLVCNSMQYIRLTTDTVLHTTVRSVST